MSSKIFSFLAIVILVFLSLFLLRTSGALQPLELAAYDIHMKLKTADDSAYSSVVLIKITEEDIHKLKQYPISDQLLSELLGRLIESNANAIGIDIFRDIPGEGRAQFKDLVEKNSNIILANKLLGKFKVKAPDFARKNQIGFVDLKQDTDSAIRRGILMVWDDEENSHFSFSLQLALIYLKKHGITITADPDNKQNIKLNEVIVKHFSEKDGAYYKVDDGGYQYLINYDQKKSLFQSYTLDQALSNKVGLKALVENKVVILGVFADSLKDLHETPFSIGNILSDEPMYGAEIHAYQVDQLINAALNNVQSMQVLSENTEWLLLLLIVITGTFSGLFISRFTRIVLLSILLGGLLFFYAQYQFDNKRWWPDALLFVAYFCSLFIAITVSMQQERKARKLITQMFGKLISPKLADHLWKNREQFLNNNRLIKQEMIATIIIIDLEGYSTISSQMTPSSLLEWNNLYSGMVADVVFQFGGIVDDFSGDGIKINFGVPIPRKTEQQIQNDVTDAIDCSLMISDRLSTLNQKLSENHLPEMRLRMGICTGPVVFGGQGSFQQMKYTTVGETVNIASRLESFQKDQFRKNKQSNFQIILSDSTHGYITDSYLKIDLGEHLIKGYVKQCQLYQLLGRKV